MFLGNTARANFRKAHNSCSVDVLAAAVCDREPLLNNHVAWVQISIADKTFLALICWGIYEAVPRNNQ